MRVLVAEDEKRLNKIICEALEDEGYSVDACFDGMQALEYAQAFAELAGSLECVRQNLAEVWASLESQAPGLKDVVAGT